MYKFQIEIREWGEGCTQKLSTDLNFKVYDMSCSRMLHKLLWETDLHLYMHKLQNNMLLFLQIGRNKFYSGYTFSKCKLSTLSWAKCRIIKSALSCLVRHLSGIVYLPSYLLTPGLGSFCQSVSGIINTSPVVYWPWVGVNDEGNFPLNLRSNIAENFRINKN